MISKLLDVVITLVGVAAAIVLLLGSDVAGSYVADARSGSLTGAGIDVYVRTPFPTAGSEVVLEVRARGGNAAGLEVVTVGAGGAVVTGYRSEGVSWGSTLSSTRRQTDSARLRFQVPAGHAAGTVLGLEIDVIYVVAEEAGKDHFENRARRDVVHLDVEILSPAARRTARVLHAARALAMFALWFLAIWIVGRVHAQASAAGRKAGHESIIAALLGFLGGALVGYWLFAPTLMGALELYLPFWTMVLTVAWLLVPPLWLWQWWSYRRRQGHPIGYVFPSARVWRRR